MRIVSIFMVYNEVRHIRRVLRHQAEQGVEAYVIDNESTDGTTEIVRSLCGKGVIGGGHWRLRVVRGKDGMAAGGVAAGWAIQGGGYALWAGL